DEAAAGLLDRGPVEIPQAAAEGDQLLVAERLLADQHDRMLVPGLYQARERRLVEVPETDTPHLRAERSAGRDHFDRPGGGVALRFHCNGQRHRCLPASVLRIESIAPAVPAATGSIVGR